MGWSDDKLTAYSRIIPPGVAFPEPSIGRVVTSPSARGGGIGKQLMEQSIKQVSKLFGTTSVKIGAQVYLLNFYSDLGFRQTSAIYLEDGIEHVEMVKS
jgi:ElaA protein